MLDIGTVKTSIETKSIDDKLIIFYCKDEYFIAYQYVKEIAKQKNKRIHYLESMPASTSSAFDLFGTQDIEDDIRVFSCEEFISTNPQLAEEKNLYIITNKIDKKTKELFDNYIVEIPKLETWQIKDYVYSNAEGVDSKNLDWLIEVCQGDINRIDNELSKIKLFSENEQKYLFDSMKSEGAFRDVSTFNVFNITNAITSKDITLLLNSLREIKSIDAEPLGVVTLLYQGFRKLIQVWLAKNPTPDNTGLKSNVIYAINRSPRVYNKNQLLRCFLEMTDIDRKLKTGQIEISWLIDYTICKILTC
jgi:DNA polymerase III delta subunit